jgi:hypothetical protein
MTFHLGAGGDVTEIDGNTRGDGSDIIESELSAQGRLLEEKRQRLSDSAGGTHDANAIVTVKAGWDRGASLEGRSGGTKDVLHCSDATLF